MLGGLLVFFVGVIGFVGEAPAPTALVADS